MQPIIKSAAGVLVLSAWMLSPASAADDAPTRIARPPVIEGDWWQVAGNPDLNHLTGENQQPVDFGIWQAGDGTWQLWSCIRHTREPGKTRLFYGWEGRRLTDADWAPRGIKMRADATVGEVAGGMQAPHVIKIGDTWHMFYGNWQDICLAKSTDGKMFKRHLIDGLTGLFTEGPRAHARDPMVLRIGDRWHCFYCAHPEGKGGIWSRTSDDLIHWSAHRLVGRDPEAGSHWWNFECPHVVRVDGYYYLFYTQRYGGEPQTSVYRSLDPADFGVGDHSKFVGHLPVAAPELIRHQGRWYLAALTPELDGIRIARLRWSEVTPEGNELWQNDGEN